jgi:hypothetical protein
MRILKPLIFAVVVIPSALWSQGGRKYWVRVDTLAEYDAPATGKIVNRVYYGQAMTVYSTQGSWGRVTEPQFTARWVLLAGLAESKPPEKKQRPVPASNRDPRIAKDAIPKVGENGLSQRDVDLLWKGANYMLKTGRCSKIEYADKSTSRTNTYYVNCGGASNVFFTPSDIAK